ncbi:MAG: dienelactone hydrolase family protein, partial [Mesorhizobium sp.]
MTKQDLEIKTQDGTAKAGLFRPAAPAKAGIILYMDIFGPRTALDQMAERLAGQGYAVLVPDLFYRSVPYGPFDPKTAFADEKTKAALSALSGGTTQDMTIRDGGAFLDALAAEGITGPVGVVGYCMGGARALNAAASYPHRIVAAASFHGGNLASDAADSPHRKAA